MTPSRIQAHSSNGGPTTHVTKVPFWGRVLWIQAIALLLLFPPGLIAAGAPPDKPAESLYLQLGQVGLDPGRVFQVRGASLDRGAIQISLDDGTIAFTQDVMGRITGAFFEGEGEILLTPPSEVERRSMSLFTGMAILEERFATGYFRFNDDLFNEMRPDLRATENKQEFVDRWGGTVRNLAFADAMRLLVTFSQFLPVTEPTLEADAAKTPNGGDHFLHARLQGTKLGVFDVFFDSTAAEQIQAGQAKTVASGDAFYDLWTSFTSGANASSANRSAASPPPVPGTVSGGRMAVLDYTISAQVTPPKQLHARTKVECEVRAGEVRLLTFELSRFLQIESVSLNRKPIEFIHNPALEGTQLARQGNDVVAVMLPAPKRAGENFELEFVYGGEVLAEAGSGLLYVGARGTWYPNRGLEMSNFDMEFTYPEGWTLVATGKSTPVSAETSRKAVGEQTSRWISDRPIPLAGFNLGKYREATTRAGDVIVETYATVGVERSFPSAPIQMISGDPSDPATRPPQIVVPSRPSPAETEVAVGESAARAIQYFAQRFGPFPYSHLALTQMPGRDSQGWPGLIFLSSYIFLTEQQRQDLHYEPFRILIQQSVPAHEAAHQWWGDLITWKSYRDQWFSEGLANYCALMMLEEKNPAGFHQILEKYRLDLVEKDKDGMAPTDAGPVTLGTRLWSSKFPEGYEQISYGRGTWLFHMLRTMLKDTDEKKDKNQPAAEEPFVRALRRVREKYEGRSISTRELLEAFAEELPPSLRYEGKKSLDWFLDGWINGTSMPKLELRSVRFTPKGTGLSVSATILQKDAPPDLVTSVPVYAVILGRQPLLLGRVFADGEESSFRLTAPAGVRKIELDPYATILTSTK
jgi:Peptidase family M1 domain